MNCIIKYPVVCHILEIVVHALQILISHTISLLAPSLYADCASSGFQLVSCDWPGLLLNLILILRIVNGTEAVVLIFVGHMFEEEGSLE